jgi:hypothetical protein
MFDKKNVKIIREYHANFFARTQKQFVAKELLKIVTMVFGWMTAQKKNET